ncbi:MAG: HIT domain-containing protein, partial [Candidatus Saccharibacteria bacterium]
HLMLLPKRHMTDMTELSSQEWSAMSDAIGYAKAEFEFHSYGLASRNGEPSLTGGTIRHLHIHIVVGDPSSSEPVRVKLSSQPK